MPRHPPIALKTLDRSHCQCPPQRNSKGIIAQRRSLRDRAEMPLAQKDQLLETCPGARLGKPIISGRLSVSPRQTFFRHQANHEDRSLREWTRLQKESEQIFSLRCQTEQAASQSLPQTLFSMDDLVHQDLGGAGRDRTDDPLLAKQVLSQLSYGP